MTAFTNTNDEDYSARDRQLEIYERLIEISKQLNSTFDHMSLLRQIISAATELTDSQEASILLLDSASGELRFAITTNSDPNAMEEIIVPLEGSTAGWIVTHGEPRVIEDVASEPTHFQGVDDAIAFRTRNLLGVPMKTHKEVIGALQAVNKRDNEKYNDTDVNALTTLASLAGIAIENARLFRQSDFVAEMVHELRTPLLSLKTSTTLLLRPDLPEEKRTDMVVMMQNETNRLMSLTTEFLDLAQMESGRAKIEIAPFDLHKLLEESIHVVTPQASDKEINVINNNESMLKVNGDRGKIKQVLLNLLTNAIKYNRKEGSVYVNTQVVERDDVPMMRIAVQDTGYGIPKEDQKNMFQKFFRVQSTADKASGTGLGLVITKHIVEAHGGNIWLESESGVGTTFFFTVPILE